jgi:hypothetical protein
LIEVGIIEETNLLRSNINVKCGGLEVTVLPLRKTRIIIGNIQKDITVVKFETILAQNSELSLKLGRLQPNLRLVQKGRN